MTRASVIVDQASRAMALELANNTVNTMRECGCRAEVSIDANGWPSVLCAPPTPATKISFTATVSREQ